MGPELWLIHGASRATEMPFVTLLLNKKVIKKKLENIKDTHSINPQVNTEKAQVSRPVQVAPRRRGLDWARPATSDVVTATALVDRQVFGLFAEKVSDPQWKTWLVGFLPVL